MDAIHDIARRYQAILKKKNHNWYTNVYESVAYELESLEFIEKHLETVEQIVEKYATDSVKQETFLREWLTYGLQKITIYVHSPYLTMIPDVKEVWPLFFTESTFEDYDISFDSAKETVTNMSHMMDISHCKDEEILAIHKDKKCDCMYMCSYCDEMEMKWKKKVKEMFYSPRHIFLNNALQAEFIEKWLLANKSYSNYKWPPAKVYYDCDTGFRSFPHKIITDFAEMCKFIKDSRKKYKVGGKTPIQCCDEMCGDAQWLFRTIRPSQSSISIFIHLWNKIDLVPIWLNYDKARCKEILKML